MVIQALLIAAAVSGWLTAFWLFAHLLADKREYSQARIVVAYKRKVKVDAPLTEWLLWVRQANKDHSSTGRVVASYGGTSVAIVKRMPRQKVSKKTEPARAGKWTATDQTKKASQVSHLSHVTNEGEK